MGYLIGGYVYNHHSSRSKHAISLMPVMGNHSAGFAMQIH